MGLVIWFAFSVFYIGVGLGLVFVFGFCMGLEDVYISF